jgi:hypothetical protein
MSELGQFCILAEKQRGLACAALIQQVTNRHENCAFITPLSIHNRAVLQHIIIGVNKQKDLRVWRAFIGAIGYCGKNSDDSIRCWSILERGVFMFDDNVFFDT